MLVHWLAASGSGVNFEQSCMRIRGALDLEAFQHAWSTVFARHDVLRTAFHWRGLARPLQVVQRRVPLPFSVQTWPSFEPARLQALLAEDQARGFELERAPLVRRSEEHTSELQSLMRISYAVFCLKKKNYTTMIEASHIQYI